MKKIFKFIAFKVAVIALGGVFFVVLLFIVGGLSFLFNPFAPNKIDLGSDPLDDLPSILILFFIAFSMYKGTELFSSIKRRIKAFLL
jgi:hypothetical protein